MGNRVTVGQRDVAGTSYRQARLSGSSAFPITDPNRNRSFVAFDVLGLVTGTAVQGKAEEDLGDSLENFEADLDDVALLAHLANPFVEAVNLTVGDYAIDL